MKAFVSIFKSELWENPGHEEVLKPFFKNMEESEEAYLYIPPPGELMRFLQILKCYGISYAIRFEDLSPSRRETVAA